MSRDTDNPLAANSRSRTTSSVVLLALVLAGLYVSVPTTSAAQTPAVLGDSAHWAMWNRFPDEVGPVEAEGMIEDVHWIDGGTRFWYERRVDGRTVLLLVVSATGETETLEDTEAARAGLRARGEPEPAASGLPSPDGSMTAFMRDDNISVRWEDSGREAQVTTDGEALVRYGLSEKWSGTWSPDSRHLVLLRTDQRMLRQRPVVDWLSPNLEVDWIVPNWDRPDARQSLLTWDAWSGSVDTLAVDFAGVDAEWTTFLGWSAKGDEVFVLRPFMAERRKNIAAVAPATGNVRVVLDEVADGPGVPDTEFMGFVESGFLWASDRDGLRRLYRYGLDGQVEGPITPPNVRVAEFMALDRDAGWIYFTAHANPGRPYDYQLCRLREDGSDFQILTPEDGVHHALIAPGRDVFLDAHSSPTRPWRTDLRRVDGTLIRTLAQTDVERLRTEFGWMDAEEFVVKAADGRTDLWGVIHKPYDFDPHKAYPVVMSVYTTIWASYDPSFRAWGRRMAQLGFVAVNMALRGEGWARDRAFRTAYYGRLGCCEHDDAAAVLRSLAAERPYMDLSRVGVMGGSWGGYHAARFLLMRPDVFSVGIAERAPMVPGHHFVPFMGTKTDNPDGWEEASNIPLADRLEGNLLLIVTASDHNFGSDMRMVDALIREGKDFDLLVVPGVGHLYQQAGERGRIAGEYVWGWKIPAYLVEHLQPQP